MNRRLNRACPINEVRKFFEINPDEELTRRDITVKFGVSYGHAEQITRRMCTTGELVAFPEGRVNVYRRAP